MIEKTGKRWKRWQLVGALLIVAGTLMCSFDAARMGVEGDPSAGAMTTAVAFWFAGLAVLLRARIGAWWHHG